MEKKSINILRLPAPDASFSRAFIVKLENLKILFISGTASIGPDKETLHIGNFELQTIQAYKNVEHILKSQGMKLNDIVKWTIYLKDIDNYSDFERIRSIFFKKKKIFRNSFPASTVIQADLCRKELLIELEAIAISEK